jgi:hypothetical protein
MKKLPTGSLVKNAKTSYCLDVKRPFSGPRCYFRSSSDAEFLEICGTILSNVIIADLQKIHFAPNGFFSETSYVDVLYWDP